MSNSREVFTVYRMFDGERVFYVCPVCGELSDAEVKVHSLYHVVPIDPGVDWGTL